MTIETFLEKHPKLKWFSDRTFTGYPDFNLWLMVLLIIAGVCGYYYGISQNVHTLFNQTFGKYVSISPDCLSSGLNITNSSLTKLNDTVIK